MIKDLKPSNNASMQPQAVDSSGQQDAEVSVQEVLSEIENESRQEQHIHQQHAQMMARQQQPMSSVSAPGYGSNDLSNQLLQQQLLQQQFLQQQLLSQKEEQQQENKNGGMLQSLLDKAKQLFKRDNNLFMVSSILYLVFVYVDVLNVLKIDNFTIFEKYPYLINLVTSLIFGLTVAIVKPLM
tara:strand:+ start:437 stop:985 length:549 start_codon:yes stop_codon:yes gene_type:complete